jgi:uncharacterized protein
MTALATLLILFAQVPIPRPVGYVNDFAHALDPASIGHMTDLIVDVRAQTKGEITVVTLPDIADRAASDVALQIGREWGVGAKGEAGDPAKNLGVVVLLVPRKNHRPGSGQLFIATGRGTEGFLPDARVGRIRDAMGPLLAEEQYGPALALGVDSIASAFARQFGATLQHPPAPGEPQRPGGFPVGWLVFVLFLLLVTRGRILLWPFLFGAFGRRGGRSGWSGGGGGGGGGGFSGGGAGGRF